MTKYEAINLLANDKDLRQYAKNITRGNDLYEDLFHEALLALSEYSEEKIKSICDYQEGQHTQTDNLRRYCVMQMYIMYTSPTSPFARKYRHLEPTIPVEYNLYVVPTPYDPTFDILEKKVKDKLKEELAKEVDGYFATEARAFILYKTYGSYRKASERSGIPYPTIRILVNRFAKMVK